jgi:hypothetical protein
MTRAVFFGWHPRALVHCHVVSFGWTSGVVPRDCADATPRRNATINEYEDMTSKCRAAECTECEVTLALSRRSSACAAFIHLRRYLVDAAARVVGKITISLNLGCSGIREPQYNLNRRYVSCHMMAVVHVHPLAAMSASASHSGCRGFAACLRRLLFLSKAGRTCVEASFI